MSASDDDENLYKRTEKKIEEYVETILKIRYERTNIVVRFKNY